DHGELRLTDADVELAEAAVDAAAVRGLDIGEDRKVPRPREYVRGVAVRAEHRDDALAEDRAEAERALIGRTRDERRADAERVEHRSDTFRRVGRPRLAAVMQVGVEDLERARC